MSQFLTYKEKTIGVGDTVRVHQKISEGDKSRVQIFEGIVIAIRNQGSGKSFVVRRVGTGNVGIEKIIPVNMPSIKKIEVKRKGQVRRSKLYYLRDRVGKAATKIKEKKSQFQTTAAA